jgi:hypothetical protein
MPTLNIQFEYSTDAERLAVEQTLAYLGQLRHVAAHAPAGTVLAACEAVALNQGRDALRTTLAAAIQARAAATDDAQKKSPAPARKGRTPAGS